MANIDAKIPNAIVPDVVTICYEFDIYSVMLDRHYSDTTITVKGKLDIKHKLFSKLSSEYPKINWLL